MAIENMITRDGYYSKDLRHTSAGNYLFQQEWKFITETLNTVPQSGRILEVACGSGRITEELQRLERDTISIDLNLVSLSQLRKRIHNAPVLQVRVPDLPFQSNSFSTIIACECLDYFDHQHFLEECSRILCPGGMLIFDVLNKQSYKWQLKELAGERLDLPSAGLTYTQIQSALERIGFTIHDVQGYNWLPFRRNSDSALIPIVAGVEHFMQLNRWYELSPRFIVAAVKG